MFIFIVLGVLCLAGAAYLVGEAVTLPARERRSSVNRAATYGKFRAALGQRSSSPSASACSLRSATGSPAGR